MRRVARARWHARGEIDIGIHDSRQYQCSACRRLTTHAERLQ
jgi:hypothetical protein